MNKILLSTLYCIVDDFLTTLDDTLDGQKILLS